MNKNDFLSVEECYIISRDEAVDIFMSGPRNSYEYLKIKITSMIADFRAERK